MFNNVYAICLLVEDYQKSLGFYRDTLELALNSQDGKYADFKLGEVLLAIFQKDEAETMFPQNHMNSGGGAVIALPVEDIAKTCKELAQKGVEIFEGPKTMPWGQTVAYFKDPDNNILEITS
ncbi:VOC family protein [Candidatus Woesebacteria bacterium]|nr:VOC family protein [Candidatus Woesebacteria bacterium]